MSQFFSLEDIFFIIFVLTPKNQVFLIYPYKLALIMVDIYIFYSQLMYRAIYNSVFIEFLSKSHENDKKCTITSDSITGRNMT